MGGMHRWKWNEHGCMAFPCWTSSWESCFWLEFCLWFFWEQCVVIYDNVWRAEQGSDSSIDREELSGWELIVGDVFHTQISEAFCATITGMAVVAIGFMFPVSSGMLLTGMVLLHLFWEKYVQNNLRRLQRLDISFMMSGFFLSWNCLFKSHSAEFHPLWEWPYWHQAYHSFLLHLVVWNFGAIDIAGRISPWGHRWKEPITFPLRNPTRSFKKVPSQNYPSWLLVLGAEGTLLPCTGTLFTSSSFSIPSSICLGQL